MQGAFIQLGTAQKGRTFAHQRRRRPGGENETRTGSGRRRPLHGPVGHGRARLRPHLHCQPSVSPCDCFRDPKSFMAVVALFDMTPFPVRGALPCGHCRLINALRDRSFMAVVAVLDMTPSPVRGALPCGHCRSINALRDWSFMAVVAAPDTTCFPCVAPPCGYCRLINALRDWSFMAVVAAPDTTRSPRGALCPAATAA